MRCISIASNYASCTSCHGGYGWKDASFDFAKQENVDCLACHDTTGNYKKPPGFAGNPVTKDTEFPPGSGKIIKGIDLSKIAQKVGKSQKVGVYAFDGSDKLEKIVGFTEAEGSVDAGLERMRTYKGKDPSTNLHGAVIEGLKELERELDKDKRPLKFGTLVTFTDGTDRANRYTKDQMREEIRKKNYDNYEKLAIGVGADIGEGDLGEVGPDGTELVADKAKLKDAFDKIADRIERHKLKKVTIVKSR